VADFKLSGVKGQGQPISLVVVICNMSYGKKFDMFVLFSESDELENIAWLNRKKLVVYELKKSHSIVYIIHQFMSA